MSLQLFEQLLMFHPITLFVGGEEPITASTFLEYFELAMSSGFLRSLLWMIAKGGPDKSHDPTEYEAVQFQGYQKEMRYASSQFNENPVFDYNEFIFDRMEMHILHPEYEQAAIRFADVLYRRVQQLRTVFPLYNKRKNVGQDTRIEYNTVTGHSSGYVTTFDLERFYSETGHQLGGPCELRSAWKFNDTKPRLYYAQGGGSYFASRYMKPFAVALMESWPSTQERNRRDPNFFLNNVLSDSDLVVVWDLTSFTTNLSEAKFFLEGMAQMWENKIGEHLQYPVLDLWEGSVIMRSIPEMIRQYNNEVNVFPEFSKHRMINKYHLDEEPLTGVQWNNGMLGVPGNIGIATTLHGIVAAALAGTSHVVSVGDDAIALVHETIEDQMLSDIQKIGELSLDKVSRMGPLESQEGHVRFLKRDLHLTQDDGLVFGEDLFQLPALSYLDGTIPPGRTEPINFDVHSRAKTVVISIGKYLWSLLEYRKTGISPQAAAYFKYMYKFFEIPVRGGVPGAIKIPESMIDSLETAYQFWIPSLQFQNYDPSLVDWTDYLLSVNSSEIVRIPRMDEIGIPRYKTYQGAIFESTSTRVLQVLEDFGFVKKEKIYEEFYGSQAITGSRLRAFLKGGRVLCLYTVLKDFPEWFSSSIEWGGESYVSQGSDNITI